MKPESRSLLLRAILPAIIGIAVIIWLFADDFDPRVLSSFKITWRTALGIILAIFFVVGRDFGLTWRFHTIADGSLSWHRALRVDLMCAFTSAITPSAVGGSALAVFYLNREGLKVGRATSLTLTTLFLDEMFFVVFCPVIVALLPMYDLFGAGAHNVFFKSVEAIFWVVYAGIVVYTALLYIGILARPEWLERVIVKFFSRGFLKRWKPGAQEMMGNLRQTSEWIKGRSARWWLNVFGATTLSWFSRYFIVNALFWAFVPAASGLLVFGRQFVVWVVLMVSPTPGGSGISEWLFTNYYGDLIGDVSVALLLALLWRILSYYFYLVCGVILAPGYFASKKKETDR